MPKFFMLVGCPGSGKSTWLKEHRSTNQESFVLSTDAFIEYKATITGKTYNDAFKDNIKEAEQWLNDCLKCAITQQVDMYWDQTNLSPKVRAKKLAKIPKHYFKEAVIFLTQYDIIKKVNEDRKRIGRSLPDHILESMVKNFDISHIEHEGFDKITKINRTV